MWFRRRNVTPYLNIKSEEIVIFGELPAAEFSNLESYFRFECYNWLTLRNSFRRHFWCVNSTHHGWTQLINAPPLFAVRGCQQNEVDFTTMLSRQRGNLVLIRRYHTTHLHNCATRKITLQHTNNTFCLDVFRVKIFRYLGPYQHRRFVAHLVGSLFNHG